MPGESKADRVQILLGLYNGAPDLAEQLQSFADQSHAAWDLTVSDDGSDDDGPDILRRFAAERAARGNRVRLVSGPRRGFAANFLSLIAGVPEDTQYLALSDQDDVWLPHRLERGLAALAPLPADAPVLYCSRTWISDARLRHRRISRFFPRSPGFRNALVQNIAAGNTILLNPAATALARRAAASAWDVPGLAAHDWWLYQLITGTGGTVIWDPEPTLLYRQHQRNVIGANDGWRARMSRINMLLGDRFADWNAANIEAMRRTEDLLTADNRQFLNAFAAMRTADLASRLRRAAGLKLYRQSRPAQAALWLAVLLGKI